MKHAPAILVIMFLTCQCAFAETDAFSNYSSLSKTEKKEQDTYKLLMKEFPRLKDVDEGLGRSFKSFLGIIGMDDFMSLSLRGARGSMVLYGGKFISVKEFDQFTAKGEGFSIRLDLKSNYSRSSADIRFRGYGLDNFCIEATKDYKKQDNAKEFDGQAGTNVFLLYRIPLK